MERASKITQQNFALKKREKSWVDLLIIQWNIFKAYFVNYEKQNFVLWA